jgi:hypothetical protein
MREIAFVVEWRTWESAECEEADKVGSKSFKTLAHAKAWLDRDLKHPRSSLYRLSEWTYSGGENHYRLLREIKL